MLVQNSSQLTPGPPPRSAASKTRTKLGSTGPGTVCGRGDCVAVSAHNVSTLARACAAWSIHACACSTRARTRTHAHTYLHTRIHTRKHLTERLGACTTLTCLSPLASGTSSSSLSVAFGLRPSPRLRFRVFMLPRGAKHAQARSRSFLLPPLLRWSYSECKQLPLVSGWVPVLQLVVQLPSFLFSFLDEVYCYNCARRDDGTYLVRADERRFPLSEGFTDLAPTNRRRGRRATRSRGPR